MPNETANASFLDRDGVRLAYLDLGDIASADAPIVFIHGWGGNHTVFAPQIAYFEARRRIVAVDLRGHGESDAPKQDYTVAGYVDDIVWECRQLGLARPIIIGHSMGGNIALELATRHRELVSAIVMIDSIILPPAEFTAALVPLAKALWTPDYLMSLQQTASALFIETDDPGRREALAADVVKTPQHVLASAFENHVMRYDATAAVAGCAVPVAYIAASSPLIEMGRDLERFKEICPQLTTAKILGAGHFPSVEVPDQINAMIARFLIILNAESSGAE